MSHKCGGSALSSCGNLMWRYQSLSALSVEEKEQESSCLHEKKKKESEREREKETEKARDVAPTQNHEISRCNMIIFAESDPQQHLHHCSDDPRHMTSTR